MRNILILLTILFVGFVACRKNPPDAILPDSVELGKSEVYMNGNLDTIYHPFFFRDTFYNNMYYTFPSKLPPDYLVQFGFSWLPVSEGNFILSTERIVGKHAIPSFVNWYDEDIIGYEYGPIDLGDGYLKIDLLDTVKMEVKGRFRVKFKRKDKNGVDDLDLPKYIQYEGVFYENYTNF